jgi:hypothetical protein
MQYCAPLLPQPPLLLAHACACLLASAAVLAHLLAMLLLLLLLPARLQQRAALPANPLPAQPDASKP